MLSRQEDAGPLADAPGGYSSLRSGPEARFGQPHRTNQIIARQPTSIRLAGIYCICSLHPVARHLHLPFTHCHQSLGCIGGNATSITMLLSQLTATLMCSMQRYLCSAALPVVCAFFGISTEVRQRLPLPLPANHQPQSESSRNRHGCRQHRAGLFTGSC